LFLSPAIVGTAEEDTMETVFQSYSTLWAQPWRLVLYEGIVAGLTAVETFIYGWALILGYMFFNLMFGQNWLLKGKMARIAEQSSSYLFGPNSPLTETISRFFFIHTNASEGMVKPLYFSGTTEVITIVLVTIALFVIAGTVVSYALANFSVGQAMIYVILRKKKDDEDLVERKDEDELKEEEESAETKSEEETAAENEPPAAEEKTE